MTGNPLHDKLVNYLQDAHAMEQNVLRMLDSIISTTHDDETITRLRAHRAETERHESLLRTRLDEIGAGTSWTAETGAIMGALVKGVGDQLRSDQPGKNARDAFITEHTEIAAYELLERLALRAGDARTARIAADIRQEEIAMARWISSNWDKFLDLTLIEAGVMSTAEPVAS